MKWNTDIMKIVAIVLVITLVLSLFVRYVMLKRGVLGSPADNTEDEQIVEQVKSDEVILIEEPEKEISAPGSGFDEVDFEEKVNPYDCVQIEKVCTVTSDDGKGNLDMEYTKFYVSDVNLKNSYDKTRDFSEAVGINFFDEEKAKEIGFSDAFGFSYESCENASELFNNIRNSSGFDADLMDVTYDEEKYSFNKEESYNFNGDCSILHMLLDGMDYDELLQSNCYYTLSEEKDGVKYPCMFTAVVQYRKAGETFTKTVYLGIHYYNEEGSDDCNNGKDGNAPCPTCGETDGCKDDCIGSCCK